MGECIVKKSTKENLHAQYDRLSSQAYAWFMSSCGRELRTFEHHLVKNTLDMVKGRRLCSVGFSENINGLFVDTFSLGSLANSHSSLCSDVHFWPIESKSMDVVLLHHVLEWSHSPRRILREASRVLCPGGSIVILGFNPLSLVAGCRYFSSYYPRALRQAKLYSLSVVNEWLLTLGFSCESANFALRAAPFHYEDPETVSFFKKGILNKLPIGSIFVLVVVKERFGLISNDEAWSHDGKPAFDPSYACQAATDNKYQP